MTATARDFSLTSPDGTVKAMVNDKLQYMVTIDETDVFSGSASLTLDNGTVIDRASSPKTKNVDAVVASPFYRNSSITDCYNQLVLSAGKDWKIEFRAYNDGLAYRWIYTGKKALNVADEGVEYTFSTDAPTTLSYVVPNGGSDLDAQFFNSFENLYTTAPLSGLDSKRMAFLPVVVELLDGVKVLFVESDQSCYPGMYLLASNGKGFEGVFARRPTAERIGGYINIQKIVTEREDYIAHIDGARTLPWRIAIIGRRDTDLANSQLVYQLGAPSQIEDTSWIKPGKVAWDWWNNWNLKGVDFEAGVNQLTYQYYIDFAARNGIEYIIMDDGWSVPGCGELFSVVPQIDMPALAKYADDRGVGIILWAGFVPFEKDLEAVCEHYAKMGIKGFKVDFFDRNDQAVEEFIDRAAATAAKYNMVLDLHGYHIPAGLNRKWPNILNTEGVNGLERMKGCDISMDQMAYDTFIPFIRQAGGPMDYTQGAMLNGTRETYRKSYSLPMSQGTRCHQLGLYAALDSPLNMLCDSPSNYEAEQECTDFIAGIPTVWDETKVLDGQMGQYCVTARRKCDEWYIGGITNWTSRDITVDLSFLPEGHYSATWYIDGRNAHRNAADYKLVEENAGPSKTIHLAPGGFAAKLTKK